ncbi:MAG TPA: cupin domain-containing protein [Bacteroidales bacterium]|nr:cupin domain-containing protein [Bacteroidales bacterium]HQH10433.1 cupin domain-containing protein [Bacteroidales bacterium]
MGRKVIMMIISIAFVMSGCGHASSEAGKEKEAEALFPKGDQVTNNNFTGTTWVHMFVNSDTIFNTSMGNVTFEPKARTNWHQHPGGQVLLVTGGMGFYQEKGMQARRIQEGDVVKIPPYAEHWHGAAPESGLTHLAISVNTDEGSVVWLQPVTEEEYYQSTKQGATDNL